MPIHHLSQSGVPLYASSAAVPASVATMAALTALTASNPARTHGNIVDVDADGSRWYWHSTSVLTADNILVDSADDAPTAGRWLRCPGDVDLALPFTYATADGAVLLTIPTGAIFALERAYWEISTAMTGGSSAAIGVADSINTAAGDTLGGASGDVLATLTAGVKAGTIGAKMDALSEIHANLFQAAGNFTFERITSAFTAGAGNVHLVGKLLRNAGA